MPVQLDVRGLSVSYGGLRALEEVDLAVPQGSVVALLGPNGAGKSTLLRTVAGLVQAEAGEVRLWGEPIDRLAAHQRATMGVVLIPEGRGIFPALTVADNLAVSLGRDPRLVERVVAFFPVLGQRLGQLAGTLSGGEQQMLALARAVAAKSNGSVRPTLLMADELSLGLAPILVATMAESLSRLHADEGHTILLVEQYATHALRLAQLVYILDRGRIAWAGDPNELSASRVLVDSYLGA
jgi:branched-chain amino acid transport system ATP-binding protein